MYISLKHHIPLKLLVINQFWIVSYYKKNIFLLNLYAYGNNHIVMKIIMLIQNLYTSEGNR